MHLFKNGDPVYVGSRLAGVWVGLNPITGSHVVYKEKDNEYMSYHGWQVTSEPEQKALSANHK